MKLSPTVLREVNDAAALLQQAQFSGGYRLVYGAFNGCARTHDFGALRTANNIPGVTLNYINLNTLGEPVNPRPPGDPLPGNQRAQADRYGLRFGSPEIILVDSRGMPVKTFYSTDPNFVDRVREAVGQNGGRQPQRDGGRYQ